MKLKFMARAVVVVAVGIASATLCAALSPQTEFGDISPTNTIKDIIDAGGVAGNAVDIVTKTNISTFASVETNSIVGTINTISNTVYNSNNYLDVTGKVLTVVKGGNPIWTSKDYATLEEATNMAFKAAMAVKPVQIGDYLWQIETSHEDYEKANERFAKAYPSFGRCTGVVSGKYHGRNLDWYYDKSCSFVISSPNRSDTYASIGMSGGIKPLTQARVASGEWDDAYYTLPFAYVDGMNEKGVVIQSNVIPTNSTSASSAWRTKRSGCIISFAIIRKALDVCQSAYEAATFVNSHVFVPAEFPYDNHYLVSDRSSSYIVEDGRIISADDGLPVDVMTNFRIYGTSFGSDKRPDWNTIEPYGNGVERYELVRDAGSGTRTLSGMISAMKSVWFTKAYTEEVLIDTWLTDYAGSEAETGYPGLTVQNAKTSPGVYLGTVSSYKTLYTQEHNSSSPDYRGGKTWQTVHTAVYDKDNLTMTILSQENPASTMAFKINGEGEHGYVTEVITNGLATTNYVNEKIAAIHIGVDTNTVRSIVDSSFAPYTTNDVKTALGEYVTESVTNGLATTNYVNQEVWPITGNTNIVFVIDGTTLAIVDHGTNAWVSMQQYVPSPSDSVFSNAVLQVATNISTNDWEAVRELANLPVGTTAGGIGAVIAAIVAAIAALKKKVLKYDSTTGYYYIED